MKSLRTTLKLTKSDETNNNIEKENNIMSSRTNQYSSFIEMHLFICIAYG